MLIVERLERLSVTKEEFLILKALVIIINSTIITITILIWYDYYNSNQVIANSDCPLEEFASIERVREGILSSLHDAVFFIRSDIGQMCKKYQQVLKGTLCTEKY